MRWTFLIRQLLLMKNAAAVPLSSPTVESTVHFVEWSSAAAAADLIDRPFGMMVTTVCDLF